MKKLHLIIVLIPLLILASCSEQGKKANEVQNNAAVDSKTQEKSEVATKEKRGNGTEMTPAIMKEKIDSGKIIMLSLNGSPPPYKYQGDKIKALELPDGKFYQIEEKGGKKWINVPGKGEMEIIRLSGKVYIFDHNDRAYEVKSVNDELIAEATDLTNVLLSKKK